MTAYLIRRVAAIIPTLLILILVIVLFARLADTSVIDVILQEQASDAVSRAELEAELGLDKSLPVSYFNYIVGIPRGDIGHSLLNQRAVSEMVQERLFITLELAVFAIILGWIIGAGIGIISAIWQNSPADYVLRAVGLVGLTIPNFAIATAAVLLPAIWWGWTPQVGYTRFGDDVQGHFTQFLLPGSILAFALMGTAMRITRTQMLDVMRQDYIRTARAKGLSGQKVVMAHAVRNTLIPVVSVLGLQVASVVSGAVILETIFAFPGIGRLLIDSVNDKDWPVVQGITLVVGIWVMSINLLVDISYGLIDPRIKIGGTQA